MFRPTPGPWQCEPATLIGNGGFHVTVPFDGTDTLSLAFVGGDNAEANARLIAAAPDLLSALEHIANSCEGRAAEVARAAIAKATGGAA